MRMLPLAALCAVAAACADVPTSQTALEQDAVHRSASAQAATPSTATITFGADGHGSPFPPPDHDASYNGRDNLIPRTVVIARGGSVTFDMAALHQVAVYEPGTGPEDIAVGPAGKALVELVRSVHGERG